MLAFTVVISLDKLEYSGTSLLNRCEGLLINPLDFECVEEAFTSCVLARRKFVFKTVTFTAHAGV